MAKPKAQGVTSMRVFGYVPDAKDDTEMVLLLPGTLLIGQDGVPMRYNRALPIMVPTEGLQVISADEAEMPEVD